MGAGFVFATILLLAVSGDLRILIKRIPEPLSRPACLMRHLWRMNFALFGATASFFGARPHLFPEWMQSSGLLLLLSVLPLFVIFFWRWRLWRARRVSREKDAQLV